MRRLLLAFLALLGFVGNVPQPSAGPFRVFHAGPQGAVRRALELADDLEVVATPEDARVLVLDGVIPDPECLARCMRQGAGLVIVAAQGLDPNALRQLLGEGITLGRGSDVQKLVPLDRDLALVGDIVWASAPQVRERAIFAGLDDWQVLVIGHPDADPVLAVRDCGVARAFLLAPCLDRYNPQFQEWPYFNYLIYALTASAAGRVLKSFAEYPGSPVPHEMVTQPLLVTLLLAWGSASSHRSRNRRPLWPRPGGLCFWAVDVALWAAALLAPGVQCQAPVPRAL